MNARSIGVMIAVLSSACTLASAGEIYGKVVEGSSSVGEGAALEVKCGDKAYPETRTDKTGSYRIVIAEAGKCSMTVKYKQQSASLNIASYDEPAQIDLVLEIKDGKLSARRK